MKAQPRHGGVPEALDGTTTQVLDEDAWRMFGAAYRNGQMGALDCEWIASAGAKAAAEMQATS